MKEIHFFNHQNWGIDKKAFKPFILRLKKVIRVRQGDFNVVFVDDLTIQKFNKNYRHKDQSTDVLSFNYDEASGLVGEIYISVETAKKQAKTFSHSLQDELNKLFVHGILHLHGYDHETDQDYKIMHAIECKVLGKDMT